VPIVSGTRVSGTRVTEETPSRGRPGPAKLAMGATPPPKQAKPERVLTYTPTDEQHAELQRLATTAARTTDYRDLADNVAEWVADPEGKVGENPPSPKCSTPPTCSTPTPARPTRPRPRPTAPVSMKVRAKRPTRRFPP
jgi:hypothetical protein